MTAAGYDPAEHYDRVTEAWRLLLGEEFHYGVFESGGETLSEATGALTDLMIRSARLRPGLDLVDIGCGTGVPACRLAEQFGVRVLGITTSTVGAATATARAQAEGLEDLVGFEVRDGSDTGLPDAAFDRVWALESSHLMRDRAGLLAEFERLLRPGGLLVLCDVIRRREIPFEELRRRMDDFITLREAFGDAHMEPLELYEELARSVGLVVEDSVDLTTATLPTFNHWREKAAVNRDAVSATLGDEGFDAFVRSTDILEEFWRDGTLGYGLLSARKPAAGEAARAA